MPEVSGRVVAGPRYEELGVYDAPGLLISQVVGGDSSWKAIRGTLFNPDVLTPTERKTLRDRLLGGSSNPVMKAVTGVATNPWVWLMFATSPVGTRTLKAGKSLFSVREEYSMFQRKGLGWLRQIAGTPLENVEGTEMGEAAIAIAARVDSLREKVELGLQPARASLIERMNEMLPESRRGKITTLDLNAYRRGTPERKVVEDFVRAAAAKSHRIHENVEDPVWEAKRRIFVQRRRGDSLYHGTREDDLSSFIDERGNLHLRASENYGGKQVGVSFSPSEDVARGYMSRVQAGGGQRTEGIGHVFEVDPDALPKMIRESDTERMVPHDVVIPKGKYRVKSSPDASREALRAWEEKQAASVRSLSEDELVRRWAKSTERGEIAEDVGGGDRSGRKLTPLSAAIEQKYGVDPDGHFLAEEITARVKTGKSSMEDVERLATKYSPGALYDFGPELRKEIEGRSARATARTVSSSQVEEINRSFGDSMWGAEEVLEVKAGEGVPGDQKFLGEKKNAMIREIKEHRKDLLSRIEFGVENGSVTKAEAAQGRREVLEGLFDKVKVREEVPDVSRRAVEPSRALAHGEVIEEILSRYGEEGSGFVRAVAQSRRDAFVEYLGDAKHYGETGEFKWDEDKLAMFVTSLTRKMDGEGDSISLQGMEMLGSLLGKDKAESVVAGLKSGDFGVRMERLKTVLQPEAGAWDGDWWASRNLFDVQPVDVAGGRRWPVKSADDLLFMQERPIEASRGNVSRGASGRAIPVTELRPEVHTESLEWLRDVGGLTEEGERVLEGTVKRATKKWQKPGPNGSQLSMGYQLDFVASNERYLAEVMVSSARDTTPVTKGVLLADKETRGRLTEGVRGRSTALASGKELPISTALADLPEKAQRRISLGTALDRGYQGVQGADQQQYIREVLSPAALRKRTVDQVGQYASHLRTKEMARWFSGSWLGQQIKGWGEGGKEFIEQLEHISDPRTLMREGSLSGGVANYLYVSHLGANLGSVMLNLTQPLLLAGTTVGAKDLMGAYKDAFLEMWDYGKRRAAAGKMFLAPAEKAQLIKQSFPHHREMGIGPDFWDILEHGTPGRRGGKWARTSEVLMKGFEKSEWFNRSVTAKIVERAYKRAGRVADASDPHFIADVKRLGLQTQFGQDPLNTPTSFLTNKVMRNQLARMFLTFPTRSFMAATDVFPRMGEEKYAMGALNFGLRAMGMSALVHEVGKGLLGADMQRGLFLSASTDIIGGERLFESNGEWLRLPPVVDIPLGLIRGLVGADMELLGRSVSRMAPGGVAIARTFGMLPELPRIGNVGIQGTFVGWGQPLEDGRVPVFRASDGALVEYRHPTEIVGKALGVDLGSWNQEGGLTNYYAKQREEIVQYRHRLLMALRGNDQRRASAIRKEFGERFKNPETGQPIPLTVNEAQLKAFIRNQSVGRVERALDRIPQELRPGYGAVGQGYARNLAPGALTRPGAARARDPFRKTTVEEDRAVREMLDRAERVGAAGVRTSFEAFGS